ncbi:MAG: PKD domain-containing protein, partial [Chitinophagaceae bacterium]
GAVTCTDPVNMVPSGTSGYTVVGDTVKVCGDSVVLDAGTGHTSFLWSTGATTQKITAKTKGWYKVSTTNSSGCTGKDSAYVSIAKANIVNNDSTICKGSSVTLSVGTLGTNTVRWSTGATTSSITVAPTVSTTYYATVTDGITSCQDSVRLSMASIDTSISALDPVTVCSNTGQVRLRAGVATSYQWLKDGSPISGSTAQNYTATLSGSYRVVVTNATLCRDTSRAIAVSISSQPVPAFTINSTSQCLTGNSFALTNTSTVSSGTLTYSWNFGDGTNAATTNTTHTYAAAGTFSIKLIATSSGGCKDSSSQSVTVNPLPSVTVNSGAICQGSSITLTASGADTYQWTPSTGLSSSTGASVTATPSAN